MYVHVMSGHQSRAAETVLSRAFVPTQFNFHAGYSMCEDANPAMDMNVANKLLNMDQHSSGDDSITISGQRRKTDVKKTTSVCRSRPAYTFLSVLGKGFSS